VSDTYVHTVAMMGTVVTFQVVGHGEDAARHAERVEAVERACGWFAFVESCCSRFDHASELRRLSGQVGTPVPVSATLFEPLRFALAVAAETDGAFDPTVGATMESLGFDRNYRTGASSRTDGAVPGTATWRDVVLDEATQSVTLARPLILDLGSVAKGLAIDMAARELAPFRNFAINAGGDLYFGGHGERGLPWTVGIRHPRDEAQLVDALSVNDLAVCTSGDYARRSGAAVHHLVDPALGAPAATIASATVVAPLAMVADTLATAAFVLGPDLGVALLERHGVQGLLVTPSLEQFSTHGFAAYRSPDRGSATAARAT
jgi:thiamine biosynthesis lipoprotein